jgi:hypothetical protein
MSSTQHLPAPPRTSVDFPTGDPHRAQAAPFARSAGWLSLTAGALFVAGQAVMATFDQTMNLDTSQEPLFIAAKIVYLAGFVVLMFALIGVHGLQAHRAGRLGTIAFSTAIVGTMMLGGDLWFESFAVPWLAGGPGGQGLTSDPSIVMGLGAIFSSPSDGPWSGSPRCGQGFSPRPSPWPSSWAACWATRRCSRRGLFLSAWRSPPSACGSRSPDAGPVASRGRPDHPSAASASWSWVPGRRSRAPGGVSRGRLPLGLPASGRPARPGTRPRAWCRPC